MIKKKNEAKHILFKITGFLMTYAILISATSANSRLMVGEPQLPQKISKNSTGS